MGEKTASMPALAAGATRPDWPNDATRRADLEMHLRVRALLDRAAHVGAR